MLARACVALLFVPLLVLVLAMALVLVIETEVGAVAWTGVGTEVGIVVEALMPYIASSLFLTVRGVGGKEGKAA